MRRIGNFRFFYEGEKWEWSDEVAALHGYAPGEVEPTTELMRRHKHPEDRAHFDAVMAEMLTNHAPFSSRHRIVDTSGRVRPVAVIAHSITDATGVPIGTEGFYLDLTDAELAAVQRRVDDQVRAFRDSSGVIEQAKGMLMLVYGVNADRAFDVLRWRSQQENVKIRDVAAALVVEIQAGLSVEDHQRRRLDEIVLRPRQSSED
ncbi:ANTAR domain-containing protein [Gordonia terrae]|uniref:histidine kinase n=2 Tax=Gordonia terrae TaxID=2055 RepID=A0AAD0KFX3_9ACTN|nr:diguanylate cyclase [Gordonia terrae]AWO85601.1 ANTAR domain-containing protein [Gordonia terrae]VTR12385.1 putative diguanylate cyclase [Clostridioides difficile]VTS60554.1 putative diguanylate cyclase [Gordonia terrae]